MAKRPAQPAAETATDDDAVRLGPLSNLVGFHLRLAQEASFRAFAARVGDPNLKPRRFAILTLISANPGLTQTALGRASGRDKSTLTPALDDLVKRGLVHRDRAANDRRSYTLTLTGAGEALLAELTARAAEHDAELDRIVGADQKADFIRTLRRITMALGPA